MKRVLLTVFLAATVSAVGASQASATFCKTATASTVIEAPTTVVFDTIADVASYGEWNPFIQAVEPAGVDITVEGARFDLIVTSPLGGQTLVTPEKTTLSMRPANALRGGVLNYAFRGFGFRLLGKPERTQVFTPIEGGRTLYETSERFCGVGAKLSFLIAQAGFQQQTAALKVEAELRAGQ